MQVKYKLPYHIQKTSAVITWEWMEIGYRQYYMNNLHSITYFFMESMKFTVSFFNKMLSSIH